MKLYQHHDAADRGKATPKLKQPTTCSLPAHKINLGGTVLCVGPERDQHHHHLIIRDGSMSRKAAADYTYDGTKLVRRHLPINARPSGRALRRAEKVGAK